MINDEICKPTIIVCEHAHSEVCEHPQGRLLLGHIDSYIVAGQYHSLIKKPILYDYRDLPIYRSCYYTLVTGVTKLKRTIQNIL